MKIVITGSTGYIGSNLLAKLTEKNYDVYALIREKSELSNIRKYLNEENILKIPHDRKLLYEKMENIRPDVFIHLAGIFISEHSEENIVELFDTNIRDSAVILDAVCKSGCKNIINTGSYWQNYNNELYNPVNLYAATKEAFEKIIEYYTKACKCRAITLKLFDTYGKNDSRNKLLNILNNLDYGDEIDVTEGEQLVYFCHIDDVIEAYIHAINLICNLKEGEYKTYEIRDEKPIKLKELIKLYIENSCKNINVNYGKKAYRLREFMNPIGYDLILPGWRPQKEIVEGLKEFIE